MNRWERNKLEFQIKRLPRQVVCKLTGGHRWGEADAVIIDGPIDLPPGERDWYVLAFHKQCSFCWEIEDVPFTEEEAKKAIEAEIAFEESEG